ncbi:MAG: hypothetical protein ABIO44_08920 [Saprospiraceae bacterium]
MKTKLIVLGIIIFNIIACTDRSEIPIPSYIYIDSIDLKTSPSQGTNSHAFRDAWIYVNDTFVGAYELPVKVPVVNFGEARVKIYAGIREDGIISHPVRYSMTSPYVSNLYLDAGKIDTIEPIVEYYSDIKFPFIENFDKTHFFNQDIDGNVLTQVTLSTLADAFEGSNSGEIHLTKENPALVAWYDYSKAIPTGPNEVFLELDYKCDVRFSVGFIGFKAGETPKDLIFGTLHPKEYWNKVYFNFTQTLIDCGCENYRIGIYAVYDTSIAKVNQVIHLDNFKVLYR